VDAPPQWVLAAAYWLHMLATVVWIGSLSALALLVLPAAQRSLSATALADLLTALQRRLDPLAWLSLLVLTATGLLQMSASPSYDGLLAITNPWAAAILVKHLVIAGMVGISAWMTWGVLPALQRAALRRQRDATAADPAATQRAVWLLRLNLTLGIVVLGLTAIARAA
jgi:uncharacterized membrane protein